VDCYRKMAESTFCVEGVAWQTHWLKMRFFSDGEGFRTEMRILPVNAGQQNSVHGRIG